MLRRDFDDENFGVGQKTLMSVAMKIPSMPERLLSMAEAYG